MLLSRGLTTLRAVKYLKQVNLQNVQQIRNSHAANYRTGAPPPSKTVLIAAEAAMGFAWWWILWHIWTEPGHILGEFEYPDPKKWTDEELGIPPIEK